MYWKRGKSQAACAADTATTIATLTGLYATGLRLSKPSFDARRNPCKWAPTAMRLGLLRPFAATEVKNATLFSIDDCESSALSVQTGGWSLFSKAFESLFLPGVSEAVTRGAQMMQTCYGRDWSCAESMAAATHDLLQVALRASYRAS